MKSARFAVALAVIALFVFVRSQKLPAQALFGTISGIVTDPSGAAVPGATVKVTNSQTNVTSTLKTNAAGVYNASSLNPGVYTLAAEAKGFKTSVVKNITLEVNANPKVDLTLSVGAINEVVVVTAANTPILQTQESDLGQTVNEQQLEQLPTQSSSGRNIYSLIPLAQGVSEQVGQGGYGNDNLRINGDRPRDQDYQLDGTTIEAPVFGGQTLSPSVDSIQEFRVEENSMSAEYGKTGGGVLIAVTKSGTNDFHGSAYEYNRNENFDARDYFLPASVRQNPHNYNEFGGTIGGPILKNKLFFFTDYQGIRSHGSSTSAEAFVPDAAFRSGDLAALCSAGFDASGNCLGSGQIYYPGTTNPVPYNKITQINPISQKLLALFPTPNAPGVNPGTAGVNYSSPFRNSLNRFNPRIDYTISQSDRIFGVFHRETGPSINYDLVIGPAGEQLSETSDNSLTAGWTHTFNSSMLNDFRLGYMHRIGDRATYGQGFTSPADFGFSGIPNCLSSVPNTSGGTKCGTPGISINGFSGFSTGQTLYEPASTLQFSDMVSKTLRRHNVKIGAEFRHYAIDNYQPNGVVGSFDLNGSQTGNGFADFLFGALSSGSSVQVQNAMVSSRAWAFAYFVQDDFKLKPTLTLNLGLRYQIDDSFHELHNGNAFFDPFTATWEQFGVNAPAASFNRSLKEFGPRVGFAWNPKGGFVVRGGYGIMFPGSTGHGRAGDSQPGPNLLATTPIDAGTNWSSLPAITNPSPAAITAPIPVNGNVSFSYWSPRNQPPTYVQLWNFTVEQQIGRNTVAQLGYVGSHGTHLPINYAYNICQQTAQSAAQFGYGATTSPYCPNAATAVLAAGGNLYDLVVNPGWWGLSSSVYNSLQAKIDHRFSHGFSLLANFTWSKLMDDSSSDWGGFGSLDVLGQDFYNRASERSVSAGNVPVRFTIAPIVELPFGPGKKFFNHGVGSEVLGGWRVTSIYTISSGSPFGITDNSYGYCNAAHLLEDRPNLVGDLFPSGFHRTLQSWFNTSALDFSGTCPTGGLVDLTGPGDPTKAFGDSPRYFSSIRNPRYNDLDFSLQKDFKLPLGERTRLSFRADAFNMLNHPEFSPPNSDPTAPNFGVVASTISANGAVGTRILQLGLHLYF
jgi:Carboxypeptidase regulatory-like domain/TonB dependent receptor